MLQKCSMQTFQVSCSSLDCEGFVVAENLRVRNLNLPLAQQSDHLSARGDGGMLLENLAQRSSAFHLTRLLGRRILLPPESRRGRQFLKVCTFLRRDSEPVADRLIAQPDKPPVSRCFDCLRVSTADNGGLHSSARVWASRRIASGATRLHRNSQA